jgi:hypothetical protein
METFNYIAEKEKMKELGITGKKSKKGDIDMVSKHNNNEMMTMKAKLHRLVSRADEVIIDL